MLETTKISINLGGCCHARQVARYRDSRVGSEYTGSCWKNLRRENSPSFCDLCGKIFVNYKV